MLFCTILGTSERGVEGGRKERERGGREKKERVSGREKKRKKERVRSGKGIIRKEKRIRK